MGRAPPPSRAAVAALAAAAAAAAALLLARRYRRQKSGQHRAVKLIHDLANLLQQLPPYQTQQIQDALDKLRKTNKLKTHILDEITVKATSASSGGALAEFLPPTRFSNANQKEARSSQSMYVRRSSARKSSFEARRFSHTNGLPLVSVNASNGASSSTSSTNGLARISRDPVWEEDEPMVSFDHLSLANESELRSMLENSLYDWEFDALRLSELTNGHPMSAFGHVVFEQYGLLSSLGIETARMHRFISRVEAGYKNVPYHGSAHACCVTHAMVWFLSSENLNGVLAQDEEMLAVVISAMVHDLGHDGHSNLYHCNSNSPLAVRYAYQSVLERHHLATAFEIMSRNDSNILHSLSLEQRRTVRDLVTKMVLATDFAAHSQILSDFQSVISREIEVSPVGVTGATSVAAVSPNRGLMRPVGMASTPARVRTKATSDNPLFTSLPDFGLPTSVEGITGAAARQQFHEERLLVLQIVLKVADLSNISKGLKYYLAFTDRVLEEFHTQGDDEKRQGLPVTPDHDRERSNPAASQLSFVRYVVNPLYAALDQLIPLELQLDHLLEVEQHWECFLKN